VVWCKERDLDGTLRYVLRHAPELLPLCALTRYSRRNWSLVHTDGILNVYGSLKEVKHKAMGMLGL
jgi:hypothetical protein